MAVEAKIETITRAKAMKLLESNKNNRPLNQTNLKMLIHELQRNNFQITGETIKIADDGTLLDGQHRLQAVVQSNIPLTTLVVTGIRNDAFLYIDTGKMRSASDALALNGIKNAIQMSAVGRFAMVFQKNSTDFRGSNKRLKLSNADICAFVSKNDKNVVDSCHVGYNKKNKLINKSILGGLHFIFKRINTEDADDFCHRLIEGDALALNSPIHVLRSEFIKDAKNKRKMTSYEKVGLICKAWNYYRSNKKITDLRFDINDAIPKPI